MKAWQKLYKGMVKNTNKIQHKQKYRNNYSQKYTYPLLTATI